MFVIHNRFGIAWRACGALFLLGLAAGCASAPGVPDTRRGAVATPFPEELRIVAVGDIMLDGTARPELQEKGYGYPFTATREILQRSHVVFGNVEGPLTSRGQPQNEKQYVFRSPPEKVARALHSAGFTVVSLANNHTMDYGVEGLQQTIEVLTKVGIQHVGAGENLKQARQAAFLAVGNRTIAFLAYSLTFPESFWARHDRAGTAFGHEKHVIADVKAAREVAEIVIVSFHWGQEAKTTLRDYQPQLGRVAIDAGASVVIGHHPHILQGVERYKHGVILYSLGNYTFGSYSHVARHSAIAQLRFHGNELSELRLIPINVFNVDVIFQPQLLAGEEADVVVAQLQQLSAEQGTILHNRDGIAVLDFTDAVAHR